MLAFRLPTAFEPERSALCFAVFFLTGLPSEPSKTGRISPTQISTEPKAAAAARRQSARRSQGLARCRLRRRVGHLYVQLDHDTRESGLYFYPFDSSLVLKEIVLGPRCELPTESLNALLRSNRPEVKIIKSTLASRSFSVVETIEQAPASA